MWISAGISTVADLGEGLGPLLVFGNGHVTITCFYVLSDPSFKLATEEDSDKC